MGVIAGPMPADVPVVMVAEFCLEASKGPDPLIASSSRDSDPWQSIVAMIFHHLVSSLWAGTHKARVSLALVAGIAIP